MHAVRQNVGQSDVYLCCDSYVFSCHAVTHKFVFISEVLPKQHKCVFLGKVNIFGLSDSLWNQCLIRKPLSSNCALVSDFVSLRKHAYSNI